MTAARIRTRELVLTGLCTALIAVCAQIAVPLPTQVPMTLHIFAIALTGYLLTPKLASLAMLAYLMLGAVGVPVFSNFRGGAHVLLGPTGGFLLGFVLMAAICALGNGKRRIIALLLGFAGVLAAHLAGVVQYVLLMHIGFWTAAAQVSLPFLAKDIVSVILALALAERLKKLMRKM